MKIESNVQMKEIKINGEKYEDSYKGSADKFSVEFIAENPMKPQDVIFNVSIFDQEVVVATSEFTIPKSEFSEKLRTIIRLSASYQEFEQKGGLDSFVEQLSSSLGIPAD